MIRKCELLAPAGSVEAMYAAFMAGADAVYIGGDRFGARAYAENPDREQLTEAIRLSHRLGKKLYMTVNTLLKDHELEEELIPWITPMAEEGLDGVIVQDFGVFDLLHRAFPSLPLHTSTQMVVTDYYGAALMAEAGAVRIVPARELTLPEIREIYDRTGLEIEAFVHGAMCYSYSGQCLMSSLIGGRSGNRGRCAGVCRLPFQVTENGKRLNRQDENYPLNLKDLCAVDLLPEMMEAGVMSFKIEGRMKKPEYTAGVVSVYRRYMDSAMKLLQEGRTENYRVSPEDRQKLMDLFNRDGFSTGCLRNHNGRDLVAVHNYKLSEERMKPAQMLTEKIRKELKTPEMRHHLQAPVSGTLSLSLQKGAELRCVWQDPEGRTAASCVTIPDVVQKAEKAPVTEERVRAQMEKTGGSDFYFQALDIRIDDGLFIPMKFLNELRNRAFASLEEEIDRQFRTDGPAGNKDTSEFSVTAGDDGKAERTEAQRIAEESIRAEHIAEESMVPEWKTEERSLWVLCEREAQYLAVRDSSQVTGYYLPWRIMKNHTADAGVFRLVLPFVMRRDNRGQVQHDIRSYLQYMAGKDTGRGGILVRNIGEFALLRSLGLERMAVADSGLYTMNSRARRFLEGFGAEHFTASLELNRRELKESGAVQNELVIYGRVPMMISTHCVKKTTGHCDHASGTAVLRDRKGASFPVDCRCDACYNIIWNSLPTSLLPCLNEVEDAGFRELRLHFTTEDGKTAGGVLRDFAEALKDPERKPGEKPGMKTTRGHFHRGVE
ncbi:MAG: U32 family peptidase [Eubacteriales bacterium]